MHRYVSLLVLKTAGIMEGVAGGLGLEPGPFLVSQPKEMGRALLLR